MGLFEQFFNSKKYLNDMARKSDVLVEMTPEAIREYQLYLFEMYKDIKAICDKHNIDLYVIGGTALGAVRHHGFIPWDDDMDLLMTRREFNRFAKIFKDELGEKYVMNAPNYSPKATHKFPRVMRKGSYYKRVIHSDIDNLIYIDIFLLENVPNGKLARKLKSLRATIAAYICTEVFVWENRNDEVKAFLMTNGKMGYYVRIIIGWLFSFRPSWKWFDHYDKVIQCKNEKSRDCCIATGRKKYSGEIMEREKWFPKTVGDFEGEKVNLFNDMDYYLKNLYGDYMRIPPESERERHFTCEYRFDDSWNSK